MRSELSISSVPVCLFFLEMSQVTTLWPCAFKFDWQMYASVCAFNNRDNIQVTVVCGLAAILTNNLLPSANISYS